MRFVVAALAVVVAAWMAFDGSRALIVGDYVTPRGGAYAGQLGPWSKVVLAFGIEPRSTLMRSIFAVYGLAWLVVIALFVLRVSWAWWAMLIAAIGSLWYLPFGTLLGLLQIGLLFVPSVRSVGSV